MPVGRFSAVVRMVNISALVGMTICVVGCRDSAVQHLDVDQQVPDATTSTGPYDREVKVYVQRLVSEGWDQNAAESVVNLNAEWLLIQSEENPAGLELQLKMIGDLGRHSDLQVFLTDHPETAGLLAASSNPQLISDTLRTARKNGEYNRVAGLYMQNAVASDAVAIAEALNANYDIIYMLLRRGLLGGETLFVYDRSTPAGTEYEAWLRDAISTRALASDDDLSGFVNLVMQHGEDIRQRMQADETFRDRFRTDLWPRLSNIVADEEGSFEQYLDDRYIWDLIAMENGEALLRECGLLATDLLFGDPESGRLPYPGELHDRIIQTLLRREEAAIDALMKFREETQFHRFLHRDLSPATRSAALSQLSKAGSRYTEKLTLFDRLSDTALAEEVGPPPAGIVTWIPLYYTVYEVPKKRLQGRDASGLELLSAVVDPVFLIADVVSLPAGGGTAAARKALVASGKQIAKEVGKSPLEKAAVITLKNNGREMAAKRVSKEVAERMGESELFSWSVSSGLSQMQKAFNSVATKATTIDITKPVQFMYNRSGVGRKSWRRWTGLEARLFMRGDAKVVVRLGNMPARLVGTRSAALLNHTARDVAIGAVAESAAGKELVRAGAGQVAAAKDQAQQWQKHAAAWWLLNSSTNDQKFGEAEHSTTPLMEVQTNG